jgi:mono/diheme cytochrome c family protein
VKFETRNSKLETGAADLGPRVSNFGFRISNFLVLFTALALASCRQDMQDQPKYKDLRGSAFFEDKRSARPVVEGAVARGFLYADQRFMTGKENGQPVATLPVPLTRELLERGRERYGIYCTPCHGLTGNGLGIVVQRGFRQPPSFHIDRLREVPVGYFFDVQSHGFGAMPDYAAQIPPSDRWAIAAYLRALQLSQRTTIADVPPSDRSALESSPERAAPFPIGADDWAHAIEEEKTDSAEPKEH